MFKTRKSFKQQSSAPVAFLSPDVVVASQVTLFQLCHYETTKKHVKTLLNCSSSKELPTTYSWNILVVPTTKVISLQYIIRV